MPTDDDRFHRAVERFVTSVDDARGFLALGLFFYEAHTWNEETTLGEISAQMEKIDNKQIGVVYYAASKRLLEQYQRGEIEKQLDESTRNNRVLVELTHYIDAKTSEITNQYSRIETALSMPRQIVSTAVATALIGAVAALLLFSPDLLHVLGQLFSRKP